MDIFRKPTSGEPFVPSARQTAAFIDAARDVQVLKKQLAERGGGTVLLPLKNQTGEDIPWYGVVEISSSGIDPDASADAFKARILLQADSPPTADAPLHRLAIAQQPIANGAIGLVMVVGVSQVKLDNPDGANYAFARPVEGDNSKLELSDSGVVPVVWHVASAGPQWGLVKLGTPGGGGDSGGGFPPGSAGCACEAPVRGVTLPDGVECCESLLIWEFVDPLFVDEDGNHPRRQLKYLSTETWITEEFDGPDCLVSETTVHNVYRWQLHVDSNGALLQLVVEEDNGCDLTCLRYQNESWECQAANQLERVPNWDNIPDGLFPYCRVCLEPIIAVPDEGCPYISTGLAEHYATTVNTDEFCVGGPYDGGTHTSSSACLGGGFGSITQGVCFWIGNPVTDQYPLLISSTSLASSGVLPYSFRSFTLCSQPWEFRDAYQQSFVGSGCVSDQSGTPGLPFCPGDILARWAANGATGTALSKNLGDASYPDEITIATALETCAFHPGLPTGSGKCTSCSAATAPIIPPHCCCYAGDLFHWDESLCDSFGGNFFSDCSGSEACNPEGACCLDEDTCFQDRAFRCGVIGGTFHVGADCADDPCAIPTGACCRSDGTCDVTTQADCQGAGEFYHGDDTVCASFNCGMTACCSGPPVPPGNCACSDSTWAGCGGTAQALGRGTTCASTYGYSCTNYPDVNCGWMPP